MKLNNVFITSTRDNITGALISVRVPQSFGFFPSNNSNNFGASVSYLSKMSSGMESPTNTGKYLFPSSLAS